MGRSFRLGRQGQKFVVADFETTGIERGAEPIEVGLIICDEWFRLESTFEALIAPANFLDIDNPEAWAWLDPQLGAYKVHGITPSMLRGAPTTQAVGRQVTGLFDGRGPRPVLVSDNIQFEWRFMEQLLDAAHAAWPFHFCGWDTSLLLEAAGVGDPIPAHRALRDAGLLHAAIVEALDRTRGMRA